MAKKDIQVIVPVERIHRYIYLLRGEKVMLDEDLAELYEVETRVLVQAVKRNIRRFPAEFMFQLTQEEFQCLRSQSVISNSPGRGGRRYPPYAFTEHGIAMLSTILNSEKAIQVNIAIIRAFIQMRKILAQGSGTNDFGPLKQSNWQDRSIHRIYIFNLSYDGMVHKKKRFMHEFT
jgi:phage regulator Rha-like protein